jgi:heme-degrading monooxygenase HmoA
MDGEAMVVRTWRGWVRTEQTAAYVDYIDRTGLDAYRTTPGNLGAQMWTRDLGDGRTEVVAVSWWDSRADIEGFAGGDIDVAVYYPEDDDYLVDRERTVLHFDVARQH